MPLAGNVLMNPLMGVLIVDYEHGARTLQMTGRAEIVEDTLGIPGAQRAFKFSIDEFVYVSHDSKMHPSTLETQLRSLV